MVWNNNRWFSLNVFNFLYACAYLCNESYAYVMGYYDASSLLKK